MFLKEKKSGDLVEVLSTGDLINPGRAEIAGRFHAGEEMQDPATFKKGELRFPSDEELPRCWTDPHYRD